MFECGDQIVDDKEKQGTVINSFPFRDCDDGYSYPEPSKMSGWIPVEWDDGTQGYRPVSELFYFYI